MNETRRHRNFKPATRVKSWTARVGSSSHKCAAEKNAVRPAGDWCQENKAATAAGNSEKGAACALGTVDRVIQENKIFTALAKMPDDVQTTLLRNGWIGKDSTDDNPNVVLSLHKNSERVKTVVKRYQSGLIWMDEHSRGVNWFELHPAVVTNRFPRDANAVLKLCGHAMAGNPGHDDHYPRAYPVTTVTAGSRFVSDYSLTACVSLLHAFVHGGGGAKCSKNGQVPLLALHFAVNKCEQYAADPDGRTDLTGAGAEWQTFFGHHHKIVNENQMFAVPTDGAELAALTASARRALEKVTEIRPQTTMDGRGNVWTIRCNRAAGHRAPLSNRLDDILERCDRINDGGGGGADYVVQKYVETPLLAKNDRFDVRAWLVVSTLDRCLSVWLYQTCCVHRRAHRLSVDADGRSAAGSGHRTPHQRNAVRGPVQTCGLKHLRGKLRAAVAGGGQADRNRGGDPAAVYAHIRRSVASSALAAASAGALNLRPNCFELFQAKFVVGDDYRPWLIDVESDPWTPRDLHHHAESSVAGGVAKGLAKLLTARGGGGGGGGRADDTKIGMFDLLHRCALPGQPYEPRPFAEKPAAKKHDRPGGRPAASKGARDGARSVHHVVVRNWHDELAGRTSTYVEQVRADDAATATAAATAAAAATPAADGHYRSRWSRNFVHDATGPGSATDSGAELAASWDRRAATPGDGLCLVDLKESMTRLRAGPTVDAHEAKYCLHLLDRWKTRVMSAQRFYKTVIDSNRM